MSTMKTTEIDVFADRPITDRVPNITQDQIDFYMRRGDRIRSQEIARVFGSMFSFLGHLPSHVKTTAGGVRTIFRKPSHG